MTTETQAFRFSEFGASEVLDFKTRQLPDPAPGEIQIRHLAIGVNYIDIYHRRGTAPLPLPSGIGVEGVGVITALGDGVAGFAVGARVAYVGGPPGAYATHRNLPAARALALPEDLDSREVAALVFKGLTVEYLIHRCFEVKRGDTVLFHAAAGGVGSIACQWLSHIGATVIGTVSSIEKAEIARANGCRHVILYTQEDFQARVGEITDGKGVDVVYDSVGAETFARSLDCLRPRGMLVSFGASSGPVPPLDVSALSAKGSLYVTRPSIAHYTADRAEYEAAARNLFAAIGAGVIKAAGITTYPLSKAGKAHEDLEARRTTGSVVLLP
ncbi:MULTISPECIES: quinone oxidoreductase [unclassified Ensifer]|uniref:quinone oxidoreductase family protein n=1 Tax=unclassified Ensifer TaxID=2633371 RepID=UPI0008133EC8|nr:MULTISPECIES: quinone oxidoreductase [unclassified Ensifer]OCP01728.1 quinone oxidoreductase [Ensifer sp. LC14]OCP09516.1 quinone oxidoreductase [Ensifer sp. LC13]OCP10689.1 quinone oxidoreductase [Ensifer sp. LC11]OCP32765.1 quinone oxidoreductase [Ensifer sp. LC499]